MDSLRVVLVGLRAVALNDEVAELSCSEGNTTPRASSTCGNRTRACSHRGLVHRHCRGGIITAKRVPLRDKASGTDSLARKE
eukprot:CAMPEP_0115263366 /NCGR_PEP_ID=MMETSP0270-20121206/49875_1 /TAXON_ID=71861 /ORGANISM="Scrippsiella trochoidea, Strain CCMP3099" /LENGTH=81 /DNA_ID=CAMNT_0002679349 /DNA_START=57 /DNA_END=302 /DNA_ORIENTATION=-